jgi:hypothetical protein
MPRPNPSRRRCAIYTRKSSEEWLDQHFNSLAGSAKPARPSSAASGMKAGFWPEPATTILIGNARVSDYLERHHPEILTEFRAIVAATSLEETGLRGI